VGITQKTADVGLLPVCILLHGTQTTPHDRGPSCVLELQRVVSSRLFSLTPSAFSGPVGVTQLEFRQDLCQQKTRVAGLSCGIISMILRLAVLTQ